MPIHNGPDWLVWFVYFYQSFDGGGRRVHADILPPGVMWDYSLIFFYCLSNLHLEGFGWVGGNCVEVVIE